MVTLVTFITPLLWRFERFTVVVYVAEMGMGPSLQAFEEVFPTLPYDSFTPSGKLIYNPKQKMGFDAAYYTVQEPLWRKFLSHRNRVKLAIDSLYSDDLSNLHDRWPDEDETVLLSLKLQFSFMDQDQDGLVTIKNIIQFLNEIGLAMQRSDIGLNFATNPDDGEETANIDEFLDIVQMLKVEPKKVHDFVQHKNSDGKYDIYRIAHLPVDIKIQHGLL